MSSAQPASEVLEPTQQQMTQSTYQGPAASNVQGGGGGTAGNVGGTMTGQPQTAGYIGQQALPGTQQPQQQQTFNPSSRFVCLLEQCCGVAVCFALDFRFAKLLSGKKFTD